jgi:hypothetical protein
MFQDSRESVTFNPEFLLEFFSGGGVQDPEIRQFSEVFNTLNSLLTARQ